MLHAYPVISQKGAIMLDDKALIGGRGSYPYNKGINLIVALNFLVYLDESGIHNDATWCILAGYIASPHQWTLFRHDWNEILKRHNLKKFHAREFDWRKDNASQFVIELANSIHNNALHPIGAAVEVSVFNKLTIDERRVITGGLWDSKRDKFLTSGKPSEPYFAAFIHVIQQATKKVSNKTRLNLIFGHQNVMESLALQTFKEMIAYGMNGSDKLRDITYSNDTGEPALQPADLYSYAWYNYLTHGEEIRPNLKTPMEILCKKDKGMDCLDEQASSYINWVGGK